jgi:hypothetical protein
LQKFHLMLIESLRDIPKLPFTTINKIEFSRYMKSNTAMRLFKIFIPSARKFSTELTKTSDNPDVMKELKLIQSELRYANMGIYFLLGSTIMRSILGQ